jgi:hypothetical protein
MKMNRSGGVDAETNTATGYAMGPRPAVRLPIILVKNDPDSGNRDPVARQVARLRMAEMGEEAPSFGQEQEYRQNSK